jgi:hypothetical protein
VNVPARVTSLEKSEAASAEHLITVAFPKSRSKSYSMTVELAKNAIAYGEITIEDQLFHCSVFGKDKSQTSNAIMVIEAIKNWKHTKIFARGRILERHTNIVETLKCYLIPCRMLEGFTQDVVRNRVAGPRDSINALAVRRGSFWCPNFDASKFERIFQ